MAAPVATTRTRQPSPFRPQTKVTVLSHTSVGPIAAPAMLAELLQSTFGSDYAVRAVSRSRNAGGTNKVPSLSVYIAPKGYEFAKTAEPGGVRTNKDAADILFAAAVKMGLDTSDRSAAINAAGIALAKKFNG